MQVGHSWGGTVISQAGTDAKVRSLVYVVYLAAFAPDAGQATKDLANDFAQDLSREQTEVMTATQGQIRASAFADTTSAAAWSGKQNWYVVAKQDHMINPDLQRVFAKKIGAQTTELNTSHVP